MSFYPQTNQTKEGKRGCRRFTLSLRIAPRREPPHSPCPCSTMPMSIPCLGPLRCFPFLLCAFLWFSWSSQIFSSGPVRNKSRRRKVRWMWRSAVSQCKRSNSVFANEVSYLVQYSTVQRLSPSIIMDTAANLDLITGLCVKFSAKKACRKIPLIEMRHHSTLLHIWCHLSWLSLLCCRSPIRVG